MDYMDYKGDDKEVSLQIGYKEYEAQSARHKTKKATRDQLRRDFRCRKENIKKHNKGQEGC